MVLIKQKSSFNLRSEKALMNIKTATGSKNNPVIPVIKNRQETRSIYIFLGTFLMCAFAIVMSVCTERDIIQASPSFTYLCTL